MNRHDESRASRETFEAGEAFGRALQDAAETFPGFGFGDYDPPQYADYAPQDTDDQEATGEGDDAAAAQENAAGGAGDGGGDGGELEAADNHAQSSSSFVSAHASALDAFSELAAYQGCGGGGNDDESGNGGGGGGGGGDDGDGGEGSGCQLVNNFNVSFGDDAGLTYSSPDFKFVGLSGASPINFEHFSAGVEQLMEVLLLFDFLYRFFLSFYYLRKYWSRAGLRIPEIDVRWDKYEMDIFGGGGAASVGGNGGCCLSCILAPLWGAASASSL